MKKNNMMRIASVLLVAVLLTSCVIAGTFAKYVSSTSGTDSARVAYWGWGEAGQQLGTASTDIDLFDGVYNNTVDAENGDNVVAPGTAKTATFAFAYTPKAATVNALTAGAIAAPEVDYTFAIDATIDGDYDALDDNENFYWTLKAPGATEATKYQEVEDFLAAIEALAGSTDNAAVNGVATYQAGELPENFTDADEVYTIGWVWEFEKDADAGTDGMQADAGQDADDTAMGNAQDLDDVTFNISITATQID